MKTIYKEGVADFKFKFCLQCQNGHEFCPGYPAQTVLSDLDLESQPGYFISI